MRRRCGVEKIDENTSSTESASRPRHRRPICVDNFTVC